MRAHAKSVNTLTTQSNLHRNSIGEPLHKFVNIPKSPPTSGHFSILHLRSARFPLTAVLNHIYFKFQLFALIRAKRTYRPQQNGRESIHAQFNLFKPSHTKGF